MTEEAIERDQWKARYEQEVAYWRSVEKEYGDVGNTGIRNLIAEKDALAAERDQLLAELRSCPRHDDVTGR